MSDDYGLAMSGVDPESFAELRRLRREEAIADAMYKQGMTPLQGGMVGNVYVRPSITQGLAQLANSYFAGERKRAIEKGYQDIATKREASKKKAIDALMGGTLGIPEKKETLYFDDSGVGSDMNVTTPAVPATPESKRQALFQAMASTMPEVRNVGTMVFKIDEANEAKKAAIEQRLFELKMRIAEGRITQQEADNRAAELRRDLQQNQFAHDKSMRQLAASLQQPKSAVVTEVVRDGKNVKIDANTGRVIGEAPIKGKGSALSATAQKELFEADDVINAGNSAVSILNSIIVKDPETGKSQNDIAYEGGFAGLRTAAMGYIPGQYAAEDASVDIKNKVTGQALDQLKTIFGAMPTEGERKVLLELQGSINLKSQQREAIYKRAIDLAKRRIEINMKKAKSLREGTYFNEGVSTALQEDSGGTNPSIAPPPPPGFVVNR